MSNEDENRMVLPVAEAPEQRDEDAAYEEGRQADTDYAMNHVLGDIARTDLPGAFVVLDKDGHEEVWFAASADEAEAEALERGIKVAAVKRLEPDAPKGDRYTKAFDQYYETIDWDIPLSAIIQLAWLAGAEFFGKDIAKKPQGE